MKFSSFKKDQLLMESWRSFLKEDNETEEYQRLKAKTMDGNLSPDENKRFRELAGKLDPSSWPTAPEGTKSDNPWHTAPEGSESDNPWPDYDAGEMATKWYPSKGEPGYEESFEDPGTDVYSKEGDPDKLDDIQAEIGKRAELKKALEAELGGMTPDEIRKHVEDLPADVDSGDVSKVIWAIMHPEEAKGNAPKSSLNVGPPKGSGF